jgi:hypothetical protein
MQRGQKMSNNDDNVIRNPNRKNQREVISYEPEWMRLGVKPVKMDKKQVPVIKSSKKDEINNFSAVDGKMYDEEGNEIKVEPGHIIDNNDYVFPPNVKLNPPSTQRETEEIMFEENNQPTILGQPRVGQYILLVNGKIVDTGSLEQIESVARAILYGENEGFSNQEVRVDDIVVLKRVGINVGIFIDR